MIGTLVTCEMVIKKNGVKGVEIYHYLYGCTIRIFLMNSIECISRNKLRTVFHELFTTEEKNKGILSMTFLNFLFFFFFLELMFPLLYFDSI